MYMYMHVGSMWVLNLRATSVVPSELGVMMWLQGQVSGKPVFRGWGAEFKFPLELASEV